MSALRAFSRFKSDQSFLKGLMDMPQTQHFVPGYWQSPFGLNPESFSHANWHG